MSSKAPGIHAHLNTHQDGKPYIAVTRGSWLWFKIQIEEAPSIANQIIDLYEKANNE